MAIAQPKAVLSCLTRITTNTLVLFSISPKLATRSLGIPVRIHDGATPTQIHRPLAVLQPYMYPGAALALSSRCPTLLPVQVIIALGIYIYQ